MSRLEKYPKYKDSGVEWLGEIPSEWEVKKLKFLGKIFAGLSDKKGDDFSKEYDISKKKFIPFTNICNNVKIDKEQVQYVNIKDNEKQNKLLKNDIIFLMSSETLDDIGKCSIFLHDGEFYLNSFCKGYRLFSEEAYPEYINYLLQSKLYRIYFSIVGRGFTRINIKQEYINDLFSIRPPLQEQQKIALFLDTKTQQLDKAIKQKEQLIKLLKERKQIVINEAVTKGLDKTVTMKDSGVEWLGEIPKHWEVKKIKYLGKFINGYAFNSNEFVEEGIRVMKISNIQTMKTDWTDSSYISEKYYDKLKQFRVNENDLVFALTRPIISTGIKATIIKDTEKILLNQRNTMLKPNSIVYIKWLYFIILNNDFIQIFDNLIDKTGQQPNISTKDIENIEIPLPHKDEQKQIVEYIENQTLKIDNAIDLQQKQIDKLKEYKTSLIDSIVTGKVRVCDE